MREYLQFEDGWVKLNLPVRTCLMNGLLFGLKRLLVSWGYVKIDFYAGLDTFVLKAGDEEIVKITDFKLHWHPDWSSWVEFMNDLSVQAFVMKFDELMSKSGGKGQGKLS